MATDQMKNPGSPAKGRKRFDELLAELEALGHLKKWSEYTKDVKAPTQVIAALLTGRPEILHWGKPRSLNEEECAAVYDLIGTLVETNMALQRHAQALTQLTHNMRDNAKGIMRMIDQIHDFANFRSSDEREEEDDDQ
jgi:hypothetical protein